MNPWSTKETEITYSGLLALESENLLKKKPTCNAVLHA